MLLNLASLNGQTILNVGDIQVTGATSDSNDSFSFVLWKDISAGTVIRFTDQSFTDAGNSLLGTENDMSLAFDSAVSVGSLIRVEAGGNTLTNGGAFIGTKTGSLGNLANAGDQLFVYQGAAVSGGGTSFAGRTALYGFNVGNSNWVTTAADSNHSFLPTALSGMDANLDSNNFDNADYSAARIGMTQAAYRAAIANVDNFTHSDTRFDLSTSGFTSTTSLNLVWDANGKTAGTGGTGTWDTTTQSRFSNSNADTYLHWVNSSNGNAHTAVFGGTAGVVTVASDITSSGLGFNTNGYLLTGGTISLDSSTTPVIEVKAAGDSTKIASILAGTSGIEKTGAGNLVLSANNTYSGGTLITNGSLSIGDGGITGSLGSGPVTNQSELIFNRSNNFSVSTSISGNGKLSKEGSGTMTLLGVNDYSGDTTIRSGNLIVDGTVSQSAFKVESGGTLGGSGSTGDLTIENGGKLNPGTTTGILNSGNLLMQLGSTLEIEINNTNPGTGYDQLQVTGSVTLAGTLALAINFVPMNGDLVFIMLNDGNDAVQGEFLNMVNNSIFNLSGTNYEISYFANSSTMSMIGGNDVAIQAVPESATALFGSLGFLLLMVRKRQTVC